HFFFTSFCPHRALLSFPTRRSSDLGTSVQLSGAFHLICGAPASRGGIAAICGDLTSVRALQTAATHLMKSPFCASVRSALPRILDRKSTRLNSSHLVISYAVFCLKK